MPGRSHLRSSLTRSTMRPPRSLLKFISTSMRMSHIYQPVMIATLLQTKGRASVERIAKALLLRDLSQIEYYTAVVKNMVSAVLTRHGVLRREGETYFLRGYSKLTRREVAELRALRRGIWGHRTVVLADISGTTAMKC